MINRVINWTYTNSKKRLEISLTLVPNTDLYQALDVMRQAAKNNTNCALYPEPSCYLRQVSSMGIEVTLFFWIDQLENGSIPIISDTLHVILTDFKQHHIEVAFIKLEIYGLSQAMIPPVTPPFTP